MRVSDKTTIRNYLTYLDNAKTNYARTNDRIASGNRFKRISEDVSNGTRVLRVRGDLKKTEEYLENVNSINEELSVTENSLTYINDKLVQAHTRIVKALNDPTGESGRVALANEISAIKKEIMQYANTKYNNKYVLGGTAAGTPPFAIKDDKLLYNGIDVDEIIQKDNGYVYKDANDKEHPVPMDGDIFADIGLGLKMVGSDVQSDTAFKVSYSGLEILGVGKTDGMRNNLYNLLSDIEKSMRNGDMDSLGKQDKKLVDSTDEFGKFVTEVGSKTSFLDSVETRAKSSIDSYKRQVNQLMGINDAEEAMNQTMNDYVLKAVLKMGSEILPVSLMDFIK